VLKLFNLLDETHLDRYSLNINTYSIQEI